MDGHAMKKTLKQFKIYIHAKHSRKRRRIRKFCEGVFIAILFMTIGRNLLLIFDNVKLKEDIEIGKNSNNKKINSVYGRGLVNSYGDYNKKIKNCTIQITSSHWNVLIVVDGIVVVDSGKDRKERGIHLLVLNQISGAIMSQRVFDTYIAHEDEAMILFLSMVKEGRIIIFSIKDEGTFQLRQNARNFLKKMGSKYSHLIGWRDTWALLVIKGKGVLGEIHNKAPDFNNWAPPAILEVNVFLSSDKELECNWPNTEENVRRTDFCNRFEGYGSVCLCTDPAPLDLNAPPLEGNNISDVPISIIAGNRPHYLYRTLRSLLSARGINREMVTVFIDGYFDEPLQIAHLMNVRGIQRAPTGENKARISQHYKASLTATFNLFPHSQYAIILEEDLDVSPDFISYFSQTSYLLAEDKSLYCISAWNDQGYEHSSSDPTVLLRYETMPGLGWMLSRILYKEELEPKWPTADKLWDWDMWMRMNEIRQNRECVVPEVSRVYHFGALGLNMNSYFHYLYFKKHSFNNDAYVKLKDVDSVREENYEKKIISLIRQAQPLNHTVSPCDENFIPNTTGQNYLIFIKMDTPVDFVSWLKVAKCFKIWDLDARGFHKGLWVLRIKLNLILTIGIPSSPYSHYMPSGIVPFVIQ